MPREYAERKKLFFLPHKGPLSVARRKAVRQLSLQVGDRVKIAFLHKLFGPHYQEDFEKTNPKTGTVRHVDHSDFVVIELDDPSGFLNKHLAVCALRLRRLAPE